MLPSITCNFGKKLPAAMRAKRYPDFWGSDNAVAWLLSPIGRLFGMLAVQRRARYARQPHRRQRIGVPVLIVGNLSVGGTGKTPLVNWLVECAQQLGFTPGVVLRGYGGRLSGPTRVGVDDSAVAVGDEALLIAKHTGVAVAIGRDRPAAARLLTEAGVDLVISDDGLQHLRLERDAEIVVIDGQRGLGNRRCLPAGPLREQPERLSSVDLVLCNGAQREDCQGRFDLIPGALRPVTIMDGPTHKASAPKPGDAVHALAGIGNPDRFFSTLRHLGFVVSAHPLPDHHRFRAGDLHFADGHAVVMTAKDAIKCTDIAPDNCWQLPVVAQPDQSTANQLADLINRAAERFAQRDSIS